MNNFGNIEFLRMIGGVWRCSEGRGLEIGKDYRRYRKFQHEFKLNSPVFILVRVEREELEFALVKETLDYVFPSDIK